VRDGHATTQKVKRKKSTDIPQGHTENIHTQVTYTERTQGTRTESTKHNHITQSHHTIHTQHGPLADQLHQGCEQNFHCGSLASHHHHCHHFHCGSPGPSDHHHHFHCGSLASHHRRFPRRQTSLRWEPWPLPDDHHHHQMPENQHHHHHQTT
jgi:hypothetical protein